MTIAEQIFEQYGAPSSIKRECQLQFTRKTIWLDQNYTEYRFKDGSGANVLSNGYPVLLSDIKVVLNDE